MIYVAIMFFVELTSIQFIIAGELLDVCAINDNGDAKIINASVTPKSGPQGTYLSTEMI